MRLISMGSLLRGGWRTYRGAFSAILAIGIVVSLVGFLGLLPSLVTLVHQVDAMWRIVVNTDYRPGFYDRDLVQAQLDAALQTSPDVALASAIGSGASIALGIIGSAVVSAGALAARAGRPVELGRSVAWVLARRSAIVIPAILLGLFYAAVGLATDVLETGIATSGGTPSAMQAADGPVQALALVMGLVAFYLSVRWALAVPAILVEDLGLRAGLSRSSELTRGHRLHVAGTMIVLGIVVVLGTGLSAALLGILAGVAFGSLNAAAAAFAATLAACALVWAPFTPCMFVDAYLAVAAARPPAGP